MEKETIGHRLKKQRQMKNMTLRELSEGTEGKVSASIISRIESGERANPTISTLQNLSDVLDINLGDLIGDAITEETSTYIEKLEQENYHLIETVLILQNYSYPEEVDEKEL